jgi:streptogramin lyase
VKFDGENWTSYGSPTSSGQLASPSFDAQGNIWVGSYGGGLAKLNGENWTVYRAYNSGLPHDRAWATAIDAQGNVWIGTAGGGVAKFDSVDNWTVYNTSNSGLPYNDTAIAAGSLAIDAQSNIWIGTAGGGLAKFDGVDNWTVYKTSNSGLPYNNAAGAVAVDGKGNVWIGTWGGGLAKFDGNNWTVYNTSNSGLPNNRIYSLAIDAQNNVWIGTENGLAVYRGEARPIIDLNGDGIVDSADMCIIVDNWGTDNSLCDIGPMPWGDGIVDVQDLILLSVHLFEEVNDPTLIADWALDEAEGNIAKDSTNNNDGTLYGDPTWQPNGGIVNGALLLDGIDDYVNTPRVLNPAYGKFSIFAWIKGGAPGQVIISQIDGANWLAVDPSLSCLMTNLRYSGRGGVPLQSQTVIADDTWHRIGFVWEEYIEHFMSMTSL